MLLEDLIISRVRVKMLTLFLSHPNTIFHVRDVVRRVDEEINAVRRELAHLEKGGMLSKEQRANRLFYTFRKDYPLYYELMDLITKTTGLGWDIKVFPGAYPQGIKRRRPAHRRFGRVA
jgi:hypothetical protein